MVAEAIFEVLEKNAIIAPVATAPDPHEFDLVIIGFWVIKGMPDNTANQYMAKILGKKVGIFGTLWAYRDSQHALDCMANAKELVASNKVLATFICQGKVDPKIIEAMSKVYPITPERKTRLKEAAKHPDLKDLADARAVFSKILDTGQQS
jgi:hypothetical protein